MKWRNHLSRVLSGINRLRGSQRRDNDTVYSHSSGWADTVCTGESARLLEGGCKFIILARNKVLSICSQAPLARPGREGGCWDSTWHLEEPALRLIWRRATPQEGVDGAGPPCDTPCSAPEDHPCTGTQAQTSSSESCPSHVVGLDVEPENRGPRSGSGLLTWGTGKSSTLWPPSPVSAAGRPAFLAV